MTVTEREKGAKFERLMKRWLKVEGAYASEIASASQMSYVMIKGSEAAKGLKN